MTTEPKLYFRVHHDQKQKEKWKAGVFDSCHISIPGVWMSCYRAGKIKLSDYQIPDDLDDPVLGKLQLESLLSFLKTVSMKGLDVIWSHDELINCSKLDGVCAFFDAQSIYEYATDNGFNPGGEVVAFEGEFVGDIPESDKATALSGIQVKPKNRGRTLIYQEFLAAYPNSNNSH